jgi:hypothetical protein
VHNGLCTAAAQQQQCISSESSNGQYPRGLIVVAQGYVIPKDAGTVLSKAAQVQQLALGPVSSSILITGQTSQNMQTRVSAVNDVN